MEPVPDPRWEHFVGGVQDGRPVPMSFGSLDRLASSWEPLAGIGDSEDLDGPGRLLKMARSLFRYSWFDYEFMVVACLVAFQALEAVFRILYPVPENKPLMKLVNQAEREGVLAPGFAGLARAGVELRNLHSHPATQRAFTPGMAVSVLERTHRLVGLLADVIATRSGRSSGPA
jgi:hypothetical protein